MQSGAAWGVQGSFASLRMTTRKSNNKREAVAMAASRLREPPGFARGRTRASAPPLALPYAALLGALASVVWASIDFSLPTWTLICFGFASAFLGRAIFSTPLS
jgi:hypothetical protein